MIKKNTTPTSLGWSILYSTPPPGAISQGAYGFIRVLCPCTSFKATISAVKGFGAVLKFASAKFLHSDDLVNWTAAENYREGGAHSPRKEEMNQPILGKHQLFSFQPFNLYIFCNYHKWFLGGLWSRMWLQSMAPTWYINLFVGCGVHPFL